MFYVNPICKCVFFSICVNVCEHFVYSFQVDSKQVIIFTFQWKHSRNEWKFEKLKQIWLMDNLLDENYISDDLFPLVLEYFEGCKGMAREVLMRKGMKIIKKAETETDEDNKNEIMKSIAYTRARQLLQTLPSNK